MKAQLQRSKARRVYESGFLSTSALSKFEGDPPHYLTEEEARAAVAYTTKTD
jgi:hypothetical protein